MTGLDRLAVDDDAALVRSRLDRALRRAGQGERAVGQHAPSHGVERTVAQGEALPVAGDAAAQAQGAQSGRRATRELQHAIHVGRLEVESEIGPRPGCPVARDGAAQRDARTHQVRHLEVVHPKRAGISRDVDIDAGDRVAPIVDPGHLELEPDRRAQQGEDGCDRCNRRGFGRRRRAGRRHIGIEIERTELDMGHDRQRHREARHDAACAPEVIEREDGIAHFDVAAIRPHASLDAELRQLACRDRRDIDRQPRQVSRSFGPTRLKSPDTVGAPDFPPWWTLLARRGRPAGWPSVSARRRRRPALRVPRATSRTGFLL